MGISSIWHWLIVLLVVLLVFGAGKLPKVMGDLAKGIKNFKSGMKDESDDAKNAALGQEEKVANDPTALRKDEVAKG